MIKKFPEHYAFTNPASIHDEEALTALELAGRQGAKINEVVEDQNNLRKETPGMIADEVVKHIQNGEFDEQISEYAGDLENRLNTLLGGLTEGSTTLDAEVIDLRTDFVTGETKGTAREAIESALEYMVTPENAIYEGDVSLKDKRFFMPGVYSFTYGVNLTGAPSGMSLYPDNENKIFYLKTEALGRIREVSSKVGTVAPEGIQTIYNRFGTVAYKRFFHYEPLLDSMEPTTWMDANHFHNCTTLTLEANARLNLDYVDGAGKYIVASTGVPGAPIPEAGFLLEVVEHTTGWIIQRVTGLPGNEKSFYRVGNKAPGETYATWGEWKQNRTTDMWDHEDIVIPGVDVNGLVEPKTYIIGVTDSVNNPGFTSGYLVEVVSYNKGWLVQYAHPIYPETRFFYRTGKNYNNDVASNFHEDLNVDWSEWKELADLKTVDQKISDAIATSGGGSGGSSEGGSPFTNAGQVIVNLGDSNFGNTQDSTSISSYLASFSGATVYNFGFGGARCSERDDEPWNAFSFITLAEAIASGDFSAQEEAARHPDVPEYFAETVAKMKALDWSTVDIITINFGTNDIGAGLTTSTTGMGWDMSLDPDNGIHRNDYTGALMYGTDAISFAYKNIRFVFISPLDRFDLTYNGFGLYDLSHDGKDDFMSLNFPGYVEGTKEVGDLYSSPTIEPIRALGIHFYNQERFYSDKVHLNATGRKAFAKLIWKTISGM